MLWNGEKGTLTDCIFINNSASNIGGAVCWNGPDGILINCYFLDNNLYGDCGGAVLWEGVNGILTGCTFINNTSINSGGGVAWNGVNGTLSNSTFNGNIAKSNSYGGGAIFWLAPATGGILVNCTFINNKANHNGGAVDFRSSNFIVSNSIFINNICNTTKIRFCIIIYFQLQEIFNC